MASNTTDDGWSAGNPRHLREGQAGFRDACAAIDTRDARIAELEALIAGMVMSRSTATRDRINYVNAHIDDHEKIMGDKTYAEIFADAGWHDFPGMEEST